MLGWECPKCGRCFSPFVQQCDGCEPTPVSSPTTTWAGGPCRNFSPSTSGLCATCGYPPEAHIGGTTICMMVDGQEIARSFLPHQ